MARDKLITPREAAQILGISYPTVKQWIYKKAANNQNGRRASSGSGVAA